MSGGIYKIVNTINNKVYIGSAKNFVERYKRHLKDLQMNKHINVHLQRAYIKYGEKSFNFVILESLGEYNRSEYFKHENKWMSFYDSRNYKNGYNISLAAGGGFKGRRHTKETKEKLSLKLLQNHPTRGIPLSEEHKEKIRISNLGKVISKESIEKNRQWQLKNNPRKGVPCSEEHKEKISKALSGENHWNKGGTTTDKQKESARKLFTERNPKATKVSIDGVIYATQKEAREKLHITRKVMYNRLHSNKSEWSDWKII
ncbi:hypothetical protein Henu6_gp121 [Acinetobacter phage Henu6]|jgi:group I intron endonuclease|uniref:GIY-YIG domain-containing protein n=1 Tax=Acinetobacter phage Henu6 TaxID=2500136 RepID=A0A410T5M8_9CAUD|nr:hypothetical protein Henu6_gp121 [Acinetobacter phage Henu6]